MANEQNLKPKTGLSKEEAKRMGEKGGKKSGEVRRKRKALKEQLELLLSSPAKNEKMKQQIKQKFNIKDEDIDNQMAITIAIYQKALTGDVQAYNTIRDTIGEKPIDKVENIVPPKIVDDI